MTDGDAPDPRFRTWSYAEELRWQAELLRAEIAGVGSAWDVDLNNLPAVELENEIVSLNRILWRKLLPTRAVNPSRSGYFEAKLDMTPPRPTHMSPYSQQDIAERSG